LTRISASTNFNGTKLLDKSAGVAGVLTFQVGAGNVAAADQIDVDLNGADVKAVADAVLAIDVTTDAATRLAAIGTADTQIKNVSTARSDLGAIQNRFESTIKSLNIAAENLSASESRIRDTDMASEMAKFTKNQIMSQAGTAMLAQANQINQGVLQLLG
jgi:flagellin